MAKKNLPGLQSNKRKTAEQQRATNVYQPPKKQSTATTSLSLPTNKSSSTSRNTGTSPMSLEQYQEMLQRAQNRSYTGGKAAAPELESRGQTQYLRTLKRLGLVDAYQPTMQKFAEEALQDPQQLVSSYMSDYGLKENGKLSSTLPSPWLARVQRPEEDATTQRVREILGEGENVGDMTYTQYRRYLDNAKNVLGSRASYAAKGDLAYPSGLKQSDINAAYEDMAAMQEAQQSESVQEKKRGYEAEATQARNTLKRVIQQYAAQNGSYAAQSPAYGDADALMIDGVRWDIEGIDDAHLEELARHVQNQTESASGRDYIEHYITALNAANARSARADAQLVAAKAYEGTSDLVSRAQAQPDFEANKAYTPDPSGATSKFAINDKEDAQKALAVSGTLMSFVDSPLVGEEGENYATVGRGVYQDADTQAHEILKSIYGDDPEPGKTLDQLVEQYGNITGHNTHVGSSAYSDVLFRLRGMAWGKKDAEAYDALKALQDERDGRNADTRINYATQEERDALAYYYNKGDLDSAYELYRAIEAKANQSYTDTMLPEWQAEAHADPLSAWWQNRGLGLAKGVLMPLQAAEMSRSGNAAVYSPVFEANQKFTANEQTIQQDLSDWANGSDAGKLFNGTIGKKWGKDAAWLAKFLYGTVNSAVDNAVRDVPAVLTGQKAFQTAALLLMSSQVASDTLFNDLQNGYKEDVALIHALFEGTKEFGTEKIGGERALDWMRDTGLLRHAFKSGGAEALEELMGSGADMLYEQAFGDQHGQHTQDTLEQYEKLLGQYEAAKGFGVTPENVPSWSQAESQVTKKEVGEALEEAASAFLSVTPGVVAGNSKYQASQRIGGMMEQNRLLNDRITEASKKLDNLNAQLESAGTDEARESLRSQIVDTEARLQQMKEELSARGKKIEKDFKKLTGEKVDFSTSTADQTAEVTKGDLGNGRTIKAITKDGNVLASDGTEIKASEVDWESMPATKYLYDNAVEIGQQYGISPGLIYGAYSARQDVRDYIQGVRDIATFARSGVSLSDIREKDAWAAGVDESMAQAVYEQAAAAGEADIQRRIEELKSKPAVAAGKGKTIYTDAAKALMAEEAEDSDLRTATDAVSMLAEEAGLNVTFFVSEANEEGKYENVQGAIDADATGIRIDLNAGRRTTADDIVRSAVAQVGAHELTHAIATRNPEGYRRLRQYVGSAIAKEGKSFGRILEGIKAAAKQAGQDMTDDEAMEEAVAQGFERVLGERDFAEDVAKKDPSLAEKIRDWLKGFAERVKNLFKDKAYLTVPSAIMEDHIREGAKIWDEALRGINAPRAEGAEETVAPAEAGEEAEYDTPEPGAEWDRFSMRQYAEDFDATDPRVSAKTADALAEVGLVATDGVVVAEDLAELMQDQGYEKPVDPFDDPERYSIRTMPSWSKLYRSIGGDQTVADALETFRDKMIMNDAIMQFVPTGEYKGTKMGPLRPNQEYRWTYDMDATCPRTFQFISYRNRLQAIAGRPLTEAESLNLMYLMKRMGQEIPCTYCYVENKRIERAKYYLNWFNHRQAVMAAATDEEARKAMYSYDEKKDKLGDAAQKVFDAWRAEAASGNAYAPTAQEAWTEWNTANNSVFNFLDREKSNGDIIFEPEYLLKQRNEKNAQEAQAAEEAAQAEARAAGKKRRPRKVRPKVDRNVATSQLVKMVADEFGVRLWNKGGFQKGGKNDTYSAAGAEIAGMVAQWQYDILSGQKHNYGIANDRNVSRVNEQALTLHRLASNYASSVSQARSSDNFEPYNGQLIDTDKDGKPNISEEDKQFIIAMGGFRKHSSNDFRIDYVLDYLQFYADLAAGGWTGHTYTKSVDFVKIFGACGDRINMSIAMETRNGQIVESLQEGMKWSDARNLRNAYEKNVGVMAMVTDNAQLSFALNSDWIDMIIPFHASGLPKEVWYNLRAWFDYSASQNETYFTLEDMKDRLDRAGVAYDHLQDDVEIVNGEKVVKKTRSQKIEELYYDHFNVPIIRNADGTRKKPHFYPKAYTVNGQEIPGHNNDPVLYKQLCEKYGVHPRFYGVKVADANDNIIDVTDHPNYVRLIKETSRIKDPQEPIKWNFNEKQEFLGGMSPLEYALGKMEEEAKNGGFTKSTRDDYDIVGMFRDLYLGKNRDVGWMPDRKSAKEGSVEDKFWARMDALHAAYGEIYDLTDAQKSTLDTVADEKKKTTGYQKRLKEGAAEVFAQGERNSSRSDMQMSDREVLGEAMREVAKGGEDALYLDRYQQAYHDLTASLKDQRKQERIMAKSSPTSNEYREAKNRADIYRARAAKSRTTLEKLEQDERFATLTQRERDRAEAAVARDYETGAPVEQDRDKLIRGYEKQLRERRRQLDEYRQGRRNAADRATYINRIRDYAMELSKTLGENSVKKHIPEDLKGPLNELLNSLNLYSTRSVGGGKQTQWDIRLSQRLSRVHDIIAQSEALGDDSTLYIPRDIANMLQAVTRTMEEVEAKYQGDPIVYMSNESLNELATALKAIRKAINDVNRAYASRDHARISDAAEEMAGELMSLKKAGKRADLGMVRKHLKMGLITPVYFFDRLGKAGTDTFNSLRRGYALFAQRMWIVEKFAEDTWKPSQTAKWRDEVHDFTFTHQDGSTARISLTEAQMMTLYMYDKRPAAMRHVDNGGGIKAAVIQKGRKKIVDQVSPSQLTRDDIKQIVNTLTPEQKAVCDAVTPFMKMLGNWGNEVTMTRFGYRAFGEENYFPILTSDTERGMMSEEGARGTDLYKMLNMSFTKSLTEKASNSLLIDDFFSIFANHSSDMAKYSAMALPVLDTIRIINYRNKETGSNTREAMRNAYGSLAEQYLRNFLSDLSTATKSSERMGTVSDLIKNAKVASVAGNLSVVLKQGLSIARAGIVMPELYTLPTRMIRERELIGYRKHRAEMLEHSGIARWKSMSYYDMDTGRPLEQRIAGNESRIGAIRDKAMDIAGWGAETADTLTLLRMWAVAKQRINKTRSDLVRGSDAYWDAVTEVFEDAVYRTQVVDGVMNRSDVMRSKSTWDKLRTAFMAEPILTYNTFADAVNKMSMERRSGRKISGKSVALFSRAFVAYAINGLGESLISAMMRATRDDDDYTTWFQKFIAAWLGEGDNIWERLGSSTLIDGLNPLGWIPLAQQLINGWNGESSAMDTVGLSYLKKVKDDAVKWIQWEKADPETRGEMPSIANTLKTAARALSYMAGSPLFNVGRDAVGLWNSTWGENDPNLKVQFGKPSATEGYNMLYDAILAGDDAEIARLEDRLKAHDEWDGTDSKTGEIVEGADAAKRIRNYVKKDYVGGSLGEDEAKEILDTWGQTEPNGVKSARHLLASWAYKAETGDTYSMYTPLKAALLANDPKAVAEANKVLVDEYGIKEKDLKGKAKTQIGNLYEDGLIDRKTGEKLLAAYCDMDERAIDQYWDKAEWKQENPDADVEEDFDYYMSLFPLIDKNQSIAAEVKKSYGTSTDDQINNAVRSYIKAQYTDKAYTRAEAEKKLITYGLADDAEAAWWKAEEWDYGIAHADDKNAPSYHRYIELDSYIDKGAAIPANVRSKYKYSTADDIADYAEGYLRAQYKDGKITRAQMEAGYKKYGNFKDANDIYWQLEADQYKKENGKDATYHKYEALITAMEKGGNYTAEIKRLMQHGVSDDTISGQLTSHFKPLYKAGNANTRAAIQKKMMDAWQAMGYTSKQIQTKLKNLQKNWAK